MVITSPCAKCENRRMPAISVTPTAPSAYTEPITSPVITALLMMKTMMSKALTPQKALRDFGVGDELSARAGEPVLPLRQHKPPCRKCERLPCILFNHQDADARS